MQKSKILCLQRNMQNACIEFALLIQRSYCASMHLVLIVDNWPLNHRYYTSLKTASADQKFLITTTENIMRFFNTQYWSELFSDYWKPQMTFCSCCEEFLICTQTYRWRYMTLTLIDSTAFFCYLDMPLHMKVFCKQNKSHGFWFYYEIFWVFDSNSSRQSAQWNLWPKFLSSFLILYGIWTLFFKSC